MVADLFHEVASAVHFGFLSPLAFALFLLVLDPVVVAYFPFHEQHEVVGEAFGVGLAGFSACAAAPAFALEEFAFELMEGFFNVPALFVDDDDEVGGELHFAGEVAVGGAVAGIDVDDAT